MEAIIQQQRAARVSKPISKSKEPFFGKQTIQRKLAIGSSNDAYEVEADAMADRVLSMSNSEVTTQPHSGPLVQRKCAACNEELLQKKSLAADITPLVQKKGYGHDAGTASQTLSQQVSSSKGSGHRMDSGTNNFMESRFGADFSGVNIHTGSEAIQMSRELNAQAFTVGSDIYFNEGKYNPNSHSGKHLLAHELTHTLQQGGVKRKMIQRRVIDNNVITTQEMLTQLGLTRQQVIDAIASADTAAIALAVGAETAITTQLDNAANSRTVDANIETILNEELGLSFNNRSHRRLIRQQRFRFRKVRETLESGYLRYHSLGINPVKLVGCSRGTCGESFAFTCPSNRLMVLCQRFWDTPTERSLTILHEPFHIWFSMLRHGPNVVRRSDSSCFESFAARIAGQAAPQSCVAHTNG